ncbi:hypothetical protein ACFYY1_35820 [Streptomyces sp. NPDC001890]|uniref:hypothetical protein n=1 Tax=Streptomyces sp. NPDC001890 TaxID=3364620 RepID=UPI00369EBE15
MARPHRPGERTGAPGKKRLPRFKTKQGAADSTVLDLAEPGTDGTRIVLGEHDDSAESQRWRFVPAEPERAGEPMLGWAPLSHWNGRQSWRPTPDAAPSARVPSRMSTLILSPALTDSGTRIS